MMEVQEKQMVKCKVCGKEYIFDETQIIKMNGVKGIYCTDSCGSFIAIEEKEEKVQNKERTRCIKCSTPLHLSDIEDSVLECSHCHEKMTFPKEGQTKDVIELLNQGQRELSICNFDNAYKHYDEAMKKDPLEPEAYFGKLLSEYNIQYLRDIAHYKENGTITLQPICHRENMQAIREDRNYKKAIELATDEQRKIYERKIKDIIEIDHHFKKLEQEGIDYDCFICVKVKEEDKEHYTKDSHDADILYDKLMKEGYHPFYSERTKKEQNWLGNSYEANILYGLYKAKCMIIICSDKEYLDTPWVKNEYSRYIEFMKIGKKEKGSLCIAYTDEVIEQLPGISYRLEGIKFDGFDTSEKLLDFVQRFCDETTKRDTIESIKIEYGSVAKRAKKVNQKNIEYYELGGNRKTKVTIGEEEKLSIAIQFLKNGLFSDAKRHLSNILEKNQDNGDALIYLLLAENKIKSIDEMIKEDREENFIPFLDRFDQGIKTCTKEIGMRVIETFDRLCRKCADVNELNNAETFFRFAIQYNYPGNSALRDYFLQYLVNSSKSKNEVKEKYEFFKKYIGYIDNNDVNRHIEYRLKMEESLIEKGCFQSAKELNVEIDEIDEGNKENNWNAILIETKSKDYASFISAGQVDEDTYKILEKILKYCADKKQYCNEVNKFIKAGYTDLNNGNYSSKLEIFNRAIKYYPPDSITHIVNNLNLIIDCLMKTRKYTNAINYCNIYLTYNNNDYHVYWKIVLCKLSVSNNKEAIETMVQISKIPEFSIAINYAKHDQKFIDECIDVVKKQEEYFKEKLKSAKDNLKLAESNKEMLDEKKNGIFEEKNQTKKWKKLLITYYLVFFLIFLTFEFFCTFLVIKGRNSLGFNWRIFLSIVFEIINGILLLVEPFVRQNGHVLNRNFNSKYRNSFLSTNCILYDWEYPMLFYLPFLIIASITQIVVPTTSFKDGDHVVLSTSIIVAIAMAMLKLIPWITTLLFDIKNYNTPGKFIKKEKNRINKEMNSVIAEIGFNSLAQDKLKKEIVDLNDFFRE